jgi:ribosomal protein S18 acetylase RimI-like enzyme
MRESIEITEAGPSDLEAYGAVPTAFTVDALFAVHDPAPGTRAGGGAARLVHRPVARPYVKDYDAAPGLAPQAWPARFDVSSWGVLVARAAGGERIGGAVVVPEARTVLDVDGLEYDVGDDAAVLWDLRVAPAWRRRPGSGGGGVGSTLFRAACAWAHARGATTLLIETQSTNVPACRFYARHGCTLVAARRGMYPAPLDAEVQLVWRRPLPGANFAT